MRTINDLARAYGDAYHKAEENECDAELSEQYYRQARELLVAIDAKVAALEAAATPPPVPGARYSHVAEMLDALGRAQVLRSTDQTRDSGVEFDVTGDDTAEFLDYHRASAHGLAALVESVDRLAERIGSRPAGRNETPLMRYVERAVESGYDVVLTSDMPGHTRLSISRRGSDQAAEAEPVSQPVFAAPERPQAWSDLLEGLALLATHQNNSVSPLHCEHDVLTVMADPAEFDSDELRRLEDLGFSPAEGEVFQSFRFGSA